MRFGNSLAVLAVIGALGFPSQARAQGTAVPVDVHVPLLVKILNFDRNLPMKVQGQVSIGVLYQTRYRASSAVADEVREALGRLPEDIIGGFAIQVVLIDLDQTADLVAALTRQRLHALYVAPVRGVELETVARASRTAQVLTLTGVPSYVETGLAVGIDRRGERPQIVVNVAGAREQGAEFTAQLLKLARIVKP